MRLTISLRLILALALCLGLPARGDMLTTGAGGTKPPAAAGCTQATNFLGRTSGLSGAQQTAYTNLICGLVTDGVFSKLDGLYILATTSTGNAVLNLVQNNFNITVNGSPTFSSNLGYTGTNTGSDFLDTGFNPTTATSPNFVQNSAHLMVWSNTNTTSGTAVIGVGTGTTTAMFIQNAGDNKFYARVNDGTPRAGDVVSTSFGLFLGTRSGASSGEEYQNTTQTGTTTNASTTPPNADIQIFGNLAGGADSVHQIAAISFGASLSSTDQSHLYSRLKTYMTFVGICNAVFTCP